MANIKLPGGSLTLEQLTVIFRTIPVEFDFIDQDDIIRWSSMNQHRLFKRSRQTRLGSSPWSIKATSSSRLGSNAQWQASVNLLVNHLP